MLTILSAGPTGGAWVAVQTDQPVVAALDVGSNSIKMTVARGLPDGRLEMLTGASEAVRLGAGLLKTGRIADDRFAAGLATLTRFAAIARGAGAIRMVGVATEASRKAENGQEFLARAREIGWDLRVISGDMEADLTFRGLAYDADISGWVIAADIGGASTEIILAEDGQISFARSFALGSGTITDEYVPSDPPTETELADCSAATRDIVAVVPVPETWSPRLIVTGGTGEYLGALVPDSGAITLQDIEAALATCRAVNSDALAARIGIAQARARVLPAGIAIVRGLAERFAPDAIGISHSGVRTGLLLTTIEAVRSEAGA